jgi:hypothetical protein
MKKLMKDKDKKEVKLRLQSLKWTFSDDNYNYSNQIKFIQDISTFNKSGAKDISNNDVYKIIISEINKKIYGYKQQDKIKNMFNESNFITFESIVHKMNDCQLKCRYCTNEMNVLYDISREMKQWSVDRIDNNKGHENDNYHLACLECNLKRRRRSDEKFLFTSQLNIVKIHF